MKYFKLSLFSWVDFFLLFLGRNSKFPEFLIKIFYQLTLTNILTFTLISSVEMALRRLGTGLLEFLDGAVEVVGETLKDDYKFGDATQKAIDLTVVQMWENYKAEQSPEMIKALEEVEKIIGINNF